MSYTCPRCGMTSHNPNDEREGYCGNCHDWTVESVRAWAKQQAIDAALAGLVACPDCPLCGQPPQISFSDQAFCGTDDCQVVMWIPSRTREQNLADAETVNLSGLSTDVER